MLSSPTAPAGLALFSSAFTTILSSLWNSLEPLNHCGLLNCAYAKIALSESIP
jgi:hypothetical protein